MSKFRRRLMGLAQLREAKRKDFVRVEYIENIGGSVIKNIYVEKSSTTVLKFEATVLGTGDIIGNAYSYQNGAKILGIQPDSNTAFAYYKPSGTRILLENSVVIQDTKSTIISVYSKTTRKFALDVDGTTVGGSYSGLYSNFPFALCSRNTANISPDYRGKIYAFKIYEDDVLVLDLIPMYQISTDTYGLWDRVNEEFYTSSNRVKFTGGREIIYDAEIEYLESTGTQYIQLDCNVTKTNKFTVGGVIIPIYTSNKGDYAVFGANPWAQFIGAFYSKNNNNVITYSSVIGGLGAAGGVGGGWGGTVGTEVSFELSTTEKVINGVHTAISRPLTNNITEFRIFGGYRDNHRYPIKIKSLYIKKENEILYDFIPVRIGNVGYLYDKVSNKLFGNDGTGTFVLGQDTIVYDKI